MKSLRRSGEKREKKRERDEERKKVSRRRTKSNLHRPSHRWNLYARQRPVLPSFLSHLNIFINILPATTTRHHRQKLHALLDFLPPFNRSRYVDYSLGGLSLVTLSFPHG